MVLLVPVHCGGQVLAGELPSDRRAVRDKRERAIQEVSPEVVQAAERFANLAISGRPSRLRELPPVVAKTYGRIAVVDQLHEHCSCSLVAVISV